MTTRTSQLPALPRKTPRSAPGAGSVGGRAREMLGDLQRAGLKMTPQRIAIVELFAEDASHPTAQTLFERLQPAFPTMSFATVYNTLDALARAGLSSTLRLGQAARFDPNTAPHHHAVCEVCGAISDVPADVAPEVLARQEGGEVRRAVPGFAVRTVERVYRGACRACVSKEHPNPHPSSIKQR